MDGSSSPLTTYGSDDDATVLPHDAASALRLQRNRSEDEPESAIEAISRSKQRVTR
jgi:hypothetical protein